MVVGTREKVDLWQASREAEHRRVMAESPSWADASKEELDALWGAMMLARTLEVCRSILRGDPVLVRQLHPAALRRALRGRPLPGGGDYLEITVPMMLAVAEGGPFKMRPKGRSR